MIEVRLGEPLKLSRCQRLVLNQSVMFKISHVTQRQCCALAWTSHYQSHVWLLCPLIVLELNIMLHLWLCWHKMALFNLVVWAHYRPMYVKLRLRMPYFRCLCICGINLDEPWSCPWLLPHAALLIISGSLQNHWATSAIVSGDGGYSLNLSWGSRGNSKPRVVWIL